MLPPPGGIASVILDPIWMLYDFFNIHKQGLQNFFPLCQDIVISNPDSDCVFRLLWGDVPNILLVGYQHAVGSCDDVSRGHQGPATEAAAWILVRIADLGWSFAFILLSVPYSHQPGIFVDLNQNKINKIKECKQVPLWYFVSNLCNFFTTNNSIEVSVCIRSLYTTSTLRGWNYIYTKIVAST